MLGAGGQLDEDCEDDMDQDGVSLRRLKDPQADAAFLEEQVTKWLDDEWIPQDCHKDVAKIAAGVYVRVRARSGLFVMWVWDWVWVVGVVTQICHPASITVVIGC